MNTKMTSVINNMAEAWKRSCNRISFEDSHKKALVLLSGMADVIRDNGEKMTTSDPVLLGDPLWRYVHTRIETLPLELRDAGALITAYNNKDGRAIMASFIRGDSAIAYLEKVCGSTEAAIESIKNSPVNTAAVSDDVDRLIGYFFPMSISEMVKATIEKNETGRLTKWFGDLL